MTFSLQEWLLIFGLAALALLLLHGRYWRGRGQPGSGRQGDADLALPSGAALAGEAGGAAVGPFGKTQTPATAAGQRRPAEALIVVNVLAKGEPFPGEALADLLEARGLVFGAMDIYHQMQGGAPAFSLANAVEPGTFDPARFGSFTTRGVTLFMTVKAAQGPLRRFNDMLDLANAIASELDGEVCDRSRNRMTEQAADRCRDTIRAQCKLGAGG